MATTAKKAAPRKSKATQAKSDAGSATAARSKDVKKSFGKAAPKKVKPHAPAGATSKPAKAAASTGSAPAKKRSAAGRAIRKVASTATGAVSGAVAMAASIVGGGKAAKPKGK